MKIRFHLSRSQYTCDSKLFFHDDIESLKVFKFPRVLLARQPLNVDDLTQYIRTRKDEKPIILDFSDAKTAKLIMFHVFKNVMDNKLSPLQNEVVDFIAINYNPTTNARDLLGSAFSPTARNSVEIYCYHDNSDINQAFANDDYINIASTNAVSNSILRHSSSTPPQPQPIRENNEMNLETKPTDSPITGLGIDLSTIALSTIERKVQKGNFTVIHQNISLEFLTIPAELFKSPETLKLETTTLLTITDSLRGQRRKVYDSEVLAFPFDEHRAPFNGAVRLIIENEGKTYFTNMAQLPSQTPHLIGHPPAKQWWLMLIETPKECWDTIPEFKMDAVSLNVDLAE